ncbi:hypothetical protein B9Y64_17500 [Stenotrophomonas maltophilia]|uniref:Uncharacterized protein n=1 Tax=Stenotrophomonas maltophilia TaxID=40324 RepID=A0A2J0U7K3_STEMA|nr:hypothetical protein B9Y64_17500 [Stenotrophomonas maltophilia]
MAGGTGGPYDVGVSRSWPIFSVAAATTGAGPAGLRPAPAEATATSKAGAPWDGGVGPAAGDGASTSM